jgi:hypothetical protein
VQGPVAANDACPFRDPDLLLKLARDVGGYMLAYFHSLSVHAHTIGDSLNKLAAVIGLLAGALVPSITAPPMVT